MRYDAYLFDLYGTLVDIHTDEEKPAFWKRLAAYYSEQRAEYGAESLKEAYLEEAEKLFCESQATFPEIDLGKVFSELYRKKGILPDEKIVSETAWLFRKLSTTHLRLYAGARELLACLRTKGKVILLSNAQMLFTESESIRDVILFPTMKSRNND